MKDEALTMYTESRHLEKDSLITVLELESKFVYNVTSLIQKGIDQGYFKIDDAFFAANIITYMIPFDSLRGWNFRDQYSYDQLIGKITNFILDSLNVEKEYR